ncbi:MAG TPA: hypothetical protein DCY13_19310, partial [Verrucomicrobiales bacterium]|nr:hypothetical protein [Verrucomicrobiales bacterium]
AESSFASLDILAGGPRIDCRNEHGKVTIRSMATNLTSITAQTTFGALELKLPAALKPAMQAQTSFGEIESDLPVLMKAKGKDPFENVPEETPRVRLQNQHGDIRVIAE